MNFFIMYFFKGYKNLPIFKNIDYKSCYPDVLHMFLRITDRLQKLLIIDIDAVDRAKRGKLKHI
jgi:hypothetical protein